MTLNVDITNIRVLPSYSGGVYVLQWTLVGADAAKCVVNVYRSIGAEPYLLVSTPLRSGMFVDAFQPKTKLDDVNWRFVIEHTVSGEMKHGAQVGIYDEHNVFRHTKGRALAAQQLHAIRRGGGQPCWIVPGAGTSEAKVLLDACELASTGGADMPGADLAQKWQTWISMGGLTRTETRRSDGTSKDSVEELMARLPAHPTPRLGSLIVLPSSDDRYVVGEKITPFMYASVMPIGYDVSLSLLARSDPRYRIQMPQLNPALAYPSLLPLA